MRRELREAEDAERLHELVREMDRRIALVIVEGRRDEEVLRELGYRGYIAKASSRRGGLSEFAWRIKSLVGRGPVVILTDFDSEGEEIYERLKREFEGAGVIVDERLRREIWQILRSHSIRTMESARGLLKYLGEIEYVLG